MVGASGEDCDGDNEGGGKGSESGPEDSEGGVDKGGAGGVAPRGVVVVVVVVVAVSAAERAGVVVLGCPVFCTASPADSI